MIVVKRFLYRRKTGPEWTREGWYLFGLIPLFIRDLDVRGRVCE